MARAATAEKQGDSEDGNRRRRRRREDGSPDGAANDGDRSEYIDKLVAINRVAKVVKGGKRFGFAALIIMGDGKGRVGFGTGKAREVPEAIRKATDNAKRNMVRIPLREGRTIHHDVRGMFGAGIVVLRTAPPGTGIIAGGPMRAVFEALGVQDVVAKSVGTSNPHNMVKATFAALATINSPRSVANRRGKKVNEIIGKKANDKSGETAVEA
jgi:small subunit ribosomal protein S5